MESFPPQARPSHRGRQPVSPKRWTISSTWGDDLRVTGPKIHAGPRRTVPIREDIITEEDMRVVAELLMTLDICRYPSSARIVAHELLSLVFGSDKEDNAS